MKPKQRKEQKQTSRMVLRNHDHRDCIFDKKYHNMMYVVKLKRDSHGEPVVPTEYEIAGYVWKKYPYNAFPTLGPDHPIGWMDADRQFHYANQGGTGSAAYYTPEGDSNYFHFDDFIMRVHKNSNWSSQTGFGYDVYVTKDGFHWKRVTEWTYFQGTKVDWPVSDPDDPFLLNRELFNRNGRFISGYSDNCASNGVALIRNLGAANRYVVLDLVTFSCNDNLEVGVTHVQTIIFQTSYDEQHQTTRRISDTEYYIDRYQAYAEIIGNTASGVILKKDIRTITHHYVDGQLINADTTGSKTWNFYHITYEGTWYLKDIYIVPIADPTRSFYNTFIRYCSTCRQGNTLVSVHLTFEKLDNNRYFHYLQIETTHNEGATRTYFAPLAWTTNDGYGHVEAKALAFFRNGYFYCLVGSPHDDNSRCRLFKSLRGDSWSEIPLPKWIDVPYTSKCGLNTNRNPAYEKLRVAIDPMNTSNADCTLYDLYWYDCVKFRSGAIRNVSDEFYIVFYNALFGVYLENEYFAENSRAFAWQWARESTTDLNSIYDIAEEVLDTDYCAPAGGFEGEEPDIDLNYIFYVWDDTNQEFILVDRHLSTYDHYTIVFVQELPETGQPMILYGVPMAINNNQIYDYYIYDTNQMWGNGEFVSVTDLTLYSNYTVVMVTSLPATGAANVIYAVPKDYTAYMTNMYIWNPEYEMFEDLNYTSYDMTGKRYNTVNVRRLPDVGRVGIIYISEEKYTPKSITHEDNTFNFYQFDVINMDYKLVSPVINRSKFNIIEVTSLPPFDPSSDYPHIVYKIPKELDGHDTHDYYESEAKLREFLEYHMYKHYQHLYSKDQLPLVGTPDIYYIVHETPGQYAGKYTVYLWNVLLRQYQVSATYDYFITDDPYDPKPVRIIDVLYDGMIDLVTGEAFESTGD